MSDFLNEILNHPVDKLAIAELTELRLLDVNEEFSRYFKYERMELIDRPLTTLIWKEEAGKVQRQLIDQVEAQGFAKYWDENQGKIVQVQKLSYAGRNLALVRVFDLATSKKVVQKALEHFKESLSKDPNFEFAQVGLLEAIKATNPIYRLFLKYAFAMSKLTAKYQWAVIIGFYLLFKLLRII